MSCNTQLFPSLTLLSNSYSAAADGDAIVSCVQLTFSFSLLTDLSASEMLIKGGTSGGGGGGGG